MAKPNVQSNPRVTQIFNDLDRYKEFCVAAGFKIDESTLYDMRSYVYQQFSKCMSGKHYKDQWADDARKLDINI